MLGLENNIYAQVAMVMLILASGPGALGNRTIGTAAAGGMLIGTVFGLIVVPGLYYIFGTIAEKTKLTHYEEESPIYEHIEKDE